MRPLPIFYGCLRSGTLRIGSTSCKRYAVHQLNLSNLRYAVHQLNLWPRVSLPESSPTLHWTGKVGDASVFRGPVPSGVSRVDPLRGTAPVGVAVGSRAARGAESGGTASGGAEPEGVEPGGPESEGAESGGAEPRGNASSGGPAGASPRLSPLPEPLSPQQLREWFAQRTCLRSGAAGAGDSAAGDIGAGGAGVTAGAGGTGGAAAAGPGGACTRGSGAARTGGVGGAGAGDPTEPGAAGAGGAGVVGAGAGDTGAGGAGAAGAGAVDPGAGGAGGTVRPRPYFVPLLQQVLGVPSSPGLTPPLLCPPPDESQPLLQPASALPGPSPYTQQVNGLTERRVPPSCPASPICTGRRVPRPRPPPVPGTHAMALCPSFVPLCVPLPAPPESSLPAIPDPESDGARVASPTVSRLLATVVSDPSFESTVASALVAELVDFAAAYRLDTPVLTWFSSPQPTPLSTSYLLSAPPSDESVEPSGLYPELVGCLMYLMTCTQPDLAYPLSLLACYVAPGRHRKVHWDGAKRVLRYLCSTLGIGLVLGGRGPVVLTGHAEASWPARRALLPCALRPAAASASRPTAASTSRSAALHVAPINGNGVLAPPSLEQRQQLGRMPAAAIVTMVDRVANAGIADTLETRLADARKRHADGKYGTIPLLIVALGIWSQWVTEHPSRPDSPRSVRNEGGVDDEVDGGARVSGNDGMKQRGVIKVHGGVERSQARVQQSTAAAGSSRADVDGRRHSPLRSGGGLLEAEQPTELLPQANYAAPTKLNQQQGQRGKPGGGGSGGGWSTKDVDEKRSTRDKGRGGGGRRRECWICHDPDHISYECPNHDDSNEDDIKGGRGQSTSHHPLRDAKPRKEKQTSRKTSLTKDVDNSSAVQANPMAVLLDTGCSHHLMGTKAIFVDMAPSDGVNHVRGFNGALQPVEGRGTVALQGEAGKGVLIPDVLYVLGVQANLLSAGQLKESRVQLKGDGDEMLLVATTGGVLSRACYTGQVLCTNLRPCSTRSQSTEVEALRTIIPATKSTSYQLHSRLAHVSVDTIKSSAKHEVATGLDITPSTGADPPCVSCVGGKLARHTFPDKGSDGEEALAVVQIDLCGPFRVATKDGSFYFLLLKDRHTLFVWVMPIAKKSDVLREFQKWLQNGMAEREMRTVVESVRTMLLHMGVQHNRWHLALRQPVWVCNCLERSTTPPGTTPYQMLIGKKPDLTLARVWDCMVQFMTQVHPPTDTSTAMVPLLAEVDEPADEVLPPSLFLAPPFLVADRPASTHVSATGDEGSLGALPVATASGIASGQQGAKLVDQYGKPLTTKEQQTEEPVKQEASTGVQSTGELSKSAEDLDIDKEGELSAGEESTDSDVVEVPITKPELRRTGQA
ncbi:unnamed protein product [Closterium sp. NIES-54]